MEDSNTKHAESQSNADVPGSASRRLPMVLLTGRLDEMLARLHAEYRPQTLAEEFYVREAARHATALEVLEQAEPALMRTAALAMGPMLTSETPAPDEDLLLATAISTEPLDRVARYRRGHERALHHALEKLVAYQSARPQQHTNPSVDWISKFNTEPGCIEYLQAHFDGSSWLCPRCKHRRRSWLATRRVYECAQCGMQVSLRHGTVFERSQLPLTIWFAAIRAFSACNSINVAMLTKLTGITRLATTRSVLRRIQDAFEAGDTAVGLVGLTAYPLTVNADA
jgi:hypothetical protein